MRSLLFIAVIASAASAAPVHSNGAFLGIGPFGAGPDGCMIEGVSPGGAAAEAGMHSGDLVLAIDAVPLDLKQPCDTLVNAIRTHAPGDVVRLDLARGSQRVVLSATLTTQADVLQKKVGQRLVSTDVIDVDDMRRHFDLAERKSRTTVIGFFLSQCSDCALVFEKVADGLKKRAGAAVVLGVTPRPARDDVSNLRKSFTAQVPLAIADNDTFEALSMNDQERVFFMVTDCKGIIRIVAPIAPESDDLEAAVDEVLAAAEQAEHTRTSRR